jgi:hypothetical protein
MALQKVILPSSERKPVANLERIRDVRDTERVEVTLHLGRRAPLPKEYVEPCGPWHRANRRSSTGQTRVTHKSENLVEHRHRTGVLKSPSTWDGIVTGALGGWTTALRPAPAYH